MRHRIRHVVMQSTPFCNIDCRYCYLPDRRNRVRMQASVVRRLAERVAEYQDGSEPVIWQWHAGEPLTVGLDHFSACHEAVAQGAPGLAETFRYRVQTNGTLLDRAWAEFFARHRYGIGVSLDGPREIHDANRVTRGKLGTYDKVVAGIRVLQEAGLKPGVLAVVTDLSLDRPLELLEAFADLGIESVNFNFEEMEGTNGGSSLKELDARGVLRDKVQTFMKTILREREERYPWMRLRETDWLLPGLLTGDAVENWLVEPMRYLTVLADGRVSTFCPELAGLREADRLGFPVCRIEEEDLASFARRVFASKAYQKIAEGVDDCRVSCDFFSVCGGGCPSNKFYENGSFASTETLHCRICNQYAAEAVVDYILETEAAGRSVTMPLMDA